VPIFAIVGRDIGGLCCRVSIDPVTGQNVLPSLLLPSTDLEAFILNSIGGRSVKISSLLKI
jgi:hypothetical protein